MSKILKMRMGKEHFFCMFISCYTSLNIPHRYSRSCGRQRGGARGRCLVAAAGTRYQTRAVKLRQPCRAADRPLPPGARGGAESDGAGATAPRASEDELPLQQPLFENIQTKEEYP